MSVMVVSLHFENATEVAHRSGDQIDQSRSVGENLFRAHLLLHPAGRLAEHLDLSRLGPVDLVVTMNPTRMPDLNRQETEEWLVDVLRKMLSP